MNKLIEDMYFNWSTNDTTKVPEYEKAYEALCQTEDIDETNDRDMILGDAVVAEKMLAFEAGFKTAVQLMTAALSR